LARGANLAYCAVSRVMEQLGGSALIAGGGVERTWRDIQLARVAEGNKRDVAEALLGRWMLAGC
jgi:alkylation response protein AidB-like acyl-CoA dehydrogenase